MNELHILARVSPEQFIWVCMSVTEAFLKKFLPWENPSRIPVSVEEVCYGRLCSSGYIDKVSDVRLLSVWSGVPPEKVSKTEFLNKYVTSIYYREEAEIFLRKGLDLPKIKAFNVVG